MKRPLWIWLAFGVCVTLAAVAMTRLGTMALDLERAEARMRRQAERDENLQLALWRMDSGARPADRRGGDAGHSSPTRRSTSRRAGVYPHV